MGKICRFLRFFFFFLLLLLLYFVSELRESKTKKSKISFRKLPLILYRVLKTYWFVSDDQRKWTQKTPPSVRVRLSFAAASLLFGTRGACSRSPMWTWPEPPPPPPPPENSADQERPTSLLPTLLLALMTYAWSLALVNIFILTGTNL